MASDNQQDDFLGLVLPDAGVVELTDCLTEYMTEIELDSLPDIIGQVLDDFIDQAGGMPEDLRDSDAFDVITVNQLAVTLAYQVGRLQGRSPQIVNRLIKEAVEKWEAKPLLEAPDISDKDLRSPKEKVYPRLRRLEYGDTEEDSSDEESIREHMEPPDEKLQAVEESSAIELDRFSILYLYIPLEFGIHGSLTKE